MQNKQRGIGLIQVARFAGGEWRSCHERNFFTEGLAKLTGKPAPGPHLAELWRQRRRRGVLRG
jgi:hypothetical protein